MYKNTENILLLLNTLPISFSCAISFFTSAKNAGNWFSRSTWSRCDRYLRKHQRLIKPSKYIALPANITMQTCFYHTWKPAAQVEWEYFEPGAWWDTDPCPVSWSSGARMCWPSRRQEKPRCSSVSKWEGNYQGLNLWFPGQKNIQSRGQGVYHIFLITVFNLPEWRLESSAQSCQISRRPSVQTAEVYDWLQIARPDKTHKQARA